ncbi:hypothetical protein Lepto7375DRAFT_6297 [Leptolyngbya sp. PCC 7375]|nr:hypothetical protein Lepto7375DRAFT_6297 [Leptolyngbya sp. PCC 7375]
MARHPILSEQLSKRLKALIKRASRRVSPSRSRRGSPPSSLKLKKVAVSKPPAAKATRAIANKTTAPQKRSAKSGSFWSNLLWVRPWLLVVALWLTFILMIAIALAGLSNPGREMTLEPVNSSIVGQPLSTPDAAAFSRLSIRDEKSVLSQRDPAATLPGANEQAMPAWPLLLMVVACAGGCLLVSKQGLLTAESRRRRRRVATAPVPQAGSRPVRAVRPARTPGKTASKRQRRGKHRRLAAQQRSAPKVMAVKSGQRSVPHQVPAQPSAPIASQPMSFAVTSQSAPSGPSVTVVPDNETSPLDWKEGSLAHKLDVRQTRSISSFL